MTVGNLWHMSTPNEEQHPFVRGMWPTLCRTCGKEEVDRLHTHAERQAKKAQ